jgi:hypothetical protein
MAMSVAAIMAAGRAKAAAQLLPKFHASFASGVRAGLSSGVAKTMARIPTPSQTRPTLKKR